MDRIKGRIILISSVTFIVLTLFAFPGRSAYGDVLFIGDRGNADASGQESFAAEPEELDQFLDALIEDEGFVEEDKGVKAKNPVAVLSATIKEKSRSIGSIADLSLRNIFNFAASTDNQWPFAIAGLLFIMLMMRFRRRTRKSKF